MKCSVLFLALILAFFLPRYSSARVLSRTITASSGSPIPASYAKNNSQSLVWSGLNQKDYISIVSGCDTDTFVNVDSGGSSTAPSTDGTNEIIVPAGGASYRVMPISSAVYLRGKSSITQDCDVFIEVGNTK